MRSNARISVLGVIVGGMMLLGCKTDPTQLVVVVDTDFDVPAELALVRVIVLDGDGAEAARTDFSLDTVSLPLSLAVVPRDQDASRRTTIIVQGFAMATDADPRVSRRAVTGFRENKSLRLDMFLAESCDRRMCAEITSTCTQDGCIDENIDPNGLEAVAPGQEFRERTDAGPPPDGGGDMAVDQCRTAPDRDGDGDRAMACGGGDCDDNDDRRSSRNTEVCDDENVDEDCNTTTVGDTDADNDDRVSAACCNDMGDGTLFCGNDCNDSDPLIGPTRPERCNGVDDNCDDTVDGPMADMECTSMLPGGRGSAVCDEGSCRVDVCPMGLGDCDDVFDCETNTAETAAHCGMCGNACAASDVCAASRCDGITDVSAGANHACWVYSSGHIGCRGPNIFGQLGTGTLMTPAGPVLVEGVLDAQQVALGDDHTCAIRAAGEVACWGKNDQGQVGVAAGMPVPTPTRVAGLGPARQISAGATHTCALLMTGSIVCWGDNGSGQLGNGANTSSHTPVSVMTTNTDYVQIAAGGNHTCARRMGGQVECWGANDAGQLGIGMTGGTRTSPQVVTGLTARLLAAGGRFTCARVMGMSLVQCWGENVSGQLGSTGVALSATPRDVSVAIDASDLDAGADHVCAVEPTGRVLCWGNNGSGMLGIAGMPMSAMPLPVDAIRDGRLLASGRLATYVLRASGELWFFAGAPARVPNLP